jgi:hypothetical protein
MVTIDEVLKCISHAKSGKAPGYDNIPCELLKNDSAIALLHSHFNRCFFKVVLFLLHGLRVKFHRFPSLQPQTHGILCHTRAFHWLHPCIKYTALFK